MANEDKKDFNAMLHDSKDMPKFQIITDQKSIEKYGGSRMYFAPPIEYDKVMKLIPYRTKKGYSKPTQNRTALPICAGTPTTVIPARTSSGPDFKPCLRTLKPGKWVRSSSRT